INVNNIQFNEPKFEIYSQKEKAKALDLKKFTIPFPSFLKSLKINNLNLTNGEVLTYRSEGVNYSQSSSFKLDLNSNDIYISPIEGEKFNRVESGNINTRISEFQLVLEDKSHEARLDEMIFNKNEKSLILKNFALIPSRYGQPDNMFNITAPSVILNGFEIENAYEYNDYFFDKIEFSSPKVFITLKDSINKSGLQKFSDLNLYDYLEPYLNTLEIGEFIFKGASINLITAKTKLQQENININIKNIQVGSDTKKQALLNSDGFEFTTFNYHRKSADQLYGFYIDTIKYSSLTNKAELRSIRISPLVSNEQIARKKVYQVDVVNAKINSAILSGFDFDKWLDEKIVNGEKLVIGKTELDILRNKRYPFNKNQRPLWPQQMLYHIKQPFEIDSVYLKPSTILYSELLDFGDDPVTIDFTEVSAQLGKITNIKVPGRKQKKLTIKAKGTVLQNAKIDLIVNFLPDNPEYSHFVKGSLSPVDMKTFNSVVEKSAMLTVERGQVNQFEFEFNANNTQSTGELFFDYYDLKIAVLDFRKGDTIKSKLSSFMANNFMVHSKNPRGKVFESQQIEYLRDPERSILNYWWKSIFNSAKITLGIEKEN
ncbi:MAG: hypothetical protein HQ541_17325, partial [Mariniphaga sp.]|nr:hypothetical protein [Mariniphaga sp.]